MKRLLLAVLLLLLAAVAYVIGVITYGYLNLRYEMRSAYRCDAGKVG